MRVRLYRSISFRHDASVLRVGVQARCPFCSSRFSAQPNVGQKVRFLSGLYIGQIGRRVAPHPAPRHDQFLIKFRFHPRGAVSIATVGEDLFEYGVSQKVAPWMTPLSIEDCLAFHEAVIEAVDLCVWQGAGQLDRAVAIVLGAVWIRRLPLTADEAWRVMAAHGMETAHQALFAQLFDFGLALLRRTNGRAPVQRRRMKPFSQAKYLTPSQRDFRLKHFGYA